MFKFSHSYPSKFPIQPMCSVKNMLKNVSRTLPEPHFKFHPTTNLNFGPSVGKYIKTLANPWAAEASVHLNVYLSQLISANVHISLHCRLRRRGLRPPRPAGFQRGNRWHLSVFASSEPSWSAPEKLWPTEGTLQNHINQQLTIRLLNTQIPAGFQGAYFSLLLADYVDICVKLGGLQWTLRLDWATAGALKPETSAVVTWFTWWWRVSSSSSHLSAGTGTSVDPRPTNLCVKVEKSRLIHVLVGPAHVIIIMLLLHYHIIVNKASLAANISC